MRNDRVIVVLARHAGVIAEHAGEDRRALGYFLLAARHCGRDAYLQFAIAKLHRVLGEEDAAQTALKECIRVAKQEGNDELLELAQTF